MSVDAEQLCAAFDAPAPLTVGLEEELMLLDAETLDLTPRSADVLARVERDPRFKIELPAAQFEIVTRPAERVGDAIAELRAARRELAAATDGLVRLACAGVHPF